MSLFGNKNIISRNRVFVVQEVTRVFTRIAYEFDLLITLLSLLLQRKQNTTDFTGG